MECLTFFYLIIFLQYYETNKYNLLYFIWGLGHCLNSPMPDNKKIKNKNVKKKKIIVNVRIRRFIAINTINLGMKNSVTIIKIWR